MRRFMYLMAILLISSVIARADETITVSATNSDIAANLDLKVVAKLFGEAKDLEDFEKRLNNPDSAFVNLDLNGDGDVDYIRVIETTNGNKHLIVLQAVLAKDIYQDVASIYVEKDEANNVSVQVIGDEYIYGENYVIEPVYIYRPVIYDWFWGPYWVCWSSPWYWGYWPGWWYTWHPVHYWAYWDHCHHFHHHHHGCSFHYARTARPEARTLGESVRRSDYAVANPGRSFSERNSGLTNARQLPAATRVDGDRVASTRVANGNAVSVSTPAASSSRTAVSADRSYGSSFTSAASRQPASGNARTASTDASTTTTTRSTSTTSSSCPAPTTTASRPSSTTTTRPTTSTTTTTTTRSTSTTSSSRPAPSSTASRPSSTTTVRPTGSTSSSSGRSSGSSSSISRPSGGSSAPSRPSGGSSAPSRPSGGGGSPRR